MELKKGGLVEEAVNAALARAERQEKRMLQARHLAAVVPEALEGADVPHQVLAGFALMIEGLLSEEET